MKRISFLAIFFVIASLGAIHAQQRTGFAYYDLDRLYDTIPSLFYDDTDYTPEGRLRWSGERYRAKVERAGAVIGRMAMPLAGVYGVENEEVVKDLVRASDLPYSYVHRTLNTLDGMDFALLYYADRFFTERIETGYGYLCVEGTLDGKPTAVLLTRGDRYAAEARTNTRHPDPLCRQASVWNCGKTLAQGCIGSGRAPRAGQCLRTGRLVAARPNPDRHGANRHPGRCFCPARPARSPQRNAPADLSATTLYGWHRPIFSNIFIY